MMSCVNRLKRMSVSDENKENVKVRFKYFMDFFEYNSNDNNNSKRMFILNSVIREVANGFPRETRIASQTEANCNFVQGGTDYGQFKIDYILKHHTREEGL